MGRSIAQDTHLIDLIGVSKSYDGETDALSQIHLYIRKNEFITLLGPSGCGKTTLLRLIGGFEAPSTGSILFEGKDITSVPPYKRRVNTVFQKYALFPHMNVAENIAFGLNVRKLPKRDVAQRVAEMLDMVGLRGFGKRGVDALSGGQQQRVAIARALAVQPEVLLLDEPLGALDLKLRKEMQFELKSMQQRVGITFIYVTHDQEEALTMSDTIVVMREGRIQQIGDPTSIYNEPKNAFVADFIGESNILEGLMLRDRLVRFDGADFACVDEGFGENAPVDVVVRPEDIAFVPEAGAPLAGDVVSVLFKGVHYETRVQTAQRVWKVHATQAPREGERIGMRVDPYNIHIMRRPS